MILELDAGNTRIKWRQLDEASGETIAAGVFDDAEALTASDLSGSRPVMVRMCSVRGAAVAESIGQWVTAQWGLPLQLARVTRSCAGVTNQYQDLSRMGADRWLAMIAAYNRKPGASVVVDAGTAFTVDMIDASGLHLGGYILPGRRLMMESLEGNTLIRLRRRDTESTDPGNDTDAAVLNGILASQVALLERVMQRMAAAGAPVSLFLAGGDAPLLAGELRGFAPEILASLVLDGLAYACPLPGRQEG